MYLLTKVIWVHSSKNSRRIIRNNIYMVLNKSIKKSYKPSKVENDDISMRFLVVRITT